MKNLNILNTAAKTAISFAIFLVLSTSLFGQSKETKEPVSAPTAQANPQTVLAQQTGAWTVGLDAAKNAVRVVNTAADPVAVKVVGSEPARKPFQLRISANVATGSISEDAVLPIPAGKRMIIENISAIARTGAGIRMQIQLFSYLDNGDGIGDAGDITFHRIALIDQGTYGGVTTSSANHKVLIFADEQIGTAHFSVVLQVRLDAPAAGGINQGQVTLSGYLEDLPAVP